MTGVVLCASFPDGDRGNAVSPYYPVEIAWLLARLLRRFCVRALYSDSVHIRRSVPSCCT